MSPEQVQGHSVDHRSDIFSLGLILYELLSGKRAFQGNTPVDTMQAILRLAPPDLPEKVPAAMRRIVERCLEKDPGGRFQSAHDLGFALSLASQSGSQPAGPAPISPPRRRWLIAALLAVTLLGLGAVIAGVTRRAPPVPQWSAVRLGGPEVALNPRLSPDGHLLAFQAMVDGMTQVAVMKPETGNWSVLTSRRDRGSANAVGWSPDGAFIYFNRATDVPQGIYRVPVLGGEEHLVLKDADQPVALAGGTILAVRRNAQRQLQLFHFFPETGKLQELPVLFSDLPAFDYAALLGDGTHVLLRGRAFDKPEQKPAFFEVDLSTAAIHSLPDAGVPLETWAPSRDGKTLILASPAGNLVRIMAAPLDLRSAPRTLFTVSHDVVGMDAAADGSLFVNLEDRPADLVRLSPKGGVPERLSSLPRLPLIDMVVGLPDGRVAVTVQVAGRTRLMAVEKGKDPIPLVNTTEETAAPITVAGPAAIAFAIGSSPHQTIAIADTSSGQITGRISPGKGEITSLAATPDGATLYFAAGHTVWSVPAVGGPVSKITAGSDVMMEPSGRRLVVARHEASRITIWRVTLEGGFEQQVPLDTPVLNVLQSPGAVHADGRMLVSLNPADSWFNPPALLDLASGRVTRLLNDNANDYHTLTWMPDGKIVATRQGLSAAIWKFTADGR